MTTTNPHLTSITSFEIFNFATVFGGTQANETKNKVQMHSAPVHKSNMISPQVQNKQTTDTKQ